MALSVKKPAPAASSPLSGVRPGTRAGERVRVEILGEDLRRLLESRLICAADLRCLDCASKHCIHRLCLKACARQLRRDRESCQEEIIAHEPEDT